LRGAKVEGLNSECCVRFGEFNTGRSREPAVNHSIRPDRRSRGGFRTLFEQNPGRRAEDVHALNAWHPAVRIAAVAMIGLINIWMDAEIQIDFLPKPHVAVSQAKFG